LKAGTLLIQAKKLVSHGEWGQWLKDNCPTVSDRTAQEYMYLAAKPRSIADLGKLGLGKMLMAVRHERQRQFDERKREVTREANRQIIAKVPLLEAFQKGAKFSTIVADPPWDYLDNGKAAPDFETMPWEKIKALPVADKAADDCHLYVWVPNALLIDAKEIVESWGFRYVQTLTWRKPGGLPTAWFRSTTEFVIFAVRGSQPFKQPAADSRPHTIPTCFDFKPGKGHSAKPEEFITQIVECCSPGPYLELFGRAERPGWKIWGEPTAPRKPAAKASMLKSRTERAIGKEELAQAA
jgi:N6-adenosine-specific RNA methylase IME4